MVAKKTPAKKAVKAPAKKTPAKKTPVARKAPAPAKKAARPKKAPAAPKKVARRPRLGNPDADPAKIHQYEDEDGKRRGDSEREREGDDPMAHARFLERRWFGSAPRTAELHGRALQQWRALPGVVMLRPPGLSPTDAPPANASPTASATPPQTDTE